MDWTFPLLNAIQIGSRWRRYSPAPRTAEPYSSRSPPSPPAMVRLSYVPELARVPPSSVKQPHQGASARFGRSRSLVWRAIPKVPVPPEPDAPIQANAIQANAVHIPKKRVDGPSILTVWISG